MCVCERRYKRCSTFVLGNNDDNERWQEDFYACVNTIAALNIIRIQWHKGQAKEDGDTDWDSLFMCRIPQSTAATAWRWNEWDYGCCWFEFPVDEASKWWATRSKFEQQLQRPTVDKLYWTASSMHGVTFPLFIQYSVYKMSENRISQRPVWQRHTANSLKDAEFLQCKTRKSNKFSQCTSWKRLMVLICWLSYDIIKRLRNLMCDTDVSFRGCAQNIKSH